VKPPRFAFSNIAWSPHDDPQTLALLREQGVTGIEIAPTTIWKNWEGSSVAAAARYRAFLADAGFKVPALQALLFAKPEARLFDKRGEAELLAHLAHVASLAGALGAKVAVFGAPQQRDRGTRSWPQALEDAVPVLRRAAQSFRDHGSCLCIEPNPRAYGCNFVCTSREGAELVAAVDHPGFRLHLDAAALFLEQEPLGAVLPQVNGMLRHFHVSEPQLGDFLNPQAPHRENLRALSTSGYSGWCSVEMRPPRKPLAESGPWQVLNGALRLHPGDPRG
jgi:D-psicose/D-tagatose/L-ribulose 3-epimerase